MQDIVINDWNSLPSNTECYTLDDHCKNLTLIDCMANKTLCKTLVIPTTKFIRNSNNACTNYTYCNHYK